MTALWKQEASLHPTFDKLNRCLEADWFLLPFELRLQKAHAKTLEAAGMLSHAERESLDGALVEIETSFVNQPCPTSDAEDLHTWIEGELVHRAGDAGKKIHTARSRNDQVATLLKLFVIESGERFVSDLAVLVEITCRRALQWSELAFPLQTHQQFAAPGNVGFWALRFAVAWDRIRRHTAWCADTWKQECPLGSGAVAGSSIPIDRRIQARELGFAGPSRSALDSTSSRDECIEFLALAAQAALHLQSFATDVIVFSQTPLAWTKYPAAFGTGSSMMPNKMNPDAMELLRGEAGALLSAHGHALTLLKGLPSGYNRDLQCIKPIIRDAVQRLTDLCQLTTAFLAALDFDAERLAASLRQGDIDATLRMEQLVKQGTPLREAHHAVADDVKTGSLSMGAEASQWTHAYATSGSASPVETRRVATDLLNSLMDRSSA